METSLRSHLGSKTVIATKFRTWHDSCAVVACAKTCCDLMASNGITARRSFHRTRTAGKKIVSETGPRLLRNPVSKSMQASSGSAAGPPTGWWSCRQPIRCQARKPPPTNRDPNTEISQQSRPQINGSEHDKRTFYCWYTGTLSLPHQSMETINNMINERIPVIGINNVPDTLW